jgi:hypothetical protein
MSRVGERPVRRGSGACQPPSEKTPQAQGEMQAAGCAPGSGGVRRVWLLHLLGDEGGGGRVLAGPECARAVAALCLNLSRDLGILLADHSMGERAWALGNRKALRMWGWWRVWYQVVAPCFTQSLEVLAPLNGLRITRCAGAGNHSRYKVA